MGFVPKANQINEIENSTQTNIKLQQREMFSFCGFVELSETFLVGAINELCGTELRIYPLFSIKGVTCVARV